MDDDTFTCPECNWTLPVADRGHVDPSMCGVCEDPANREANGSPDVTFTGGQVQQIRDSLHLAGVVLRSVEDDGVRSLGPAVQSVGRACLLIDAVRNSERDAGRIES